MSEPIAQVNANSSSDHMEVEAMTEGGWIQWFCSLEGNEYFVEIDEEYLRDPFNLFGLKHKFGVDKFAECLELILSTEAPNEHDLQEEEFLELNQEASDLYGLIHARFILSPRGLALMYQKYISGQFGSCPRVLCERQLLLPIGMSDESRTSRVKVFCPRCQDIFVPRDRNVNLDGSFFGTSFPHVFLKSYDQMIQVREKEVYVPKIFGFKLAKKPGTSQGSDLPRLHSSPLKP